MKKENKALIIQIISFEVKWDLKIHNQKKYVYYDLRHHYIDYCDLINFEIKKVHKRVTRYGYAQIDALIIYYLKNGKIHRIRLEVKDYIKPEIENACKAFVTKNNWMIVQIFMMIIYLHVKKMSTKN